MIETVEKSKVFTFSAKGLDKVWVEGFKKRLGTASFSKACVDGLKRLESDEVDLLAECRKLGIDGENILKGVLMSHRMSNDPTSNPDLDFFEKMRLNKEG